MERKHNVYFEESSLFFIFNICLVHKSPNHGKSSKGYIDTVIKVYELTKKKKKERLR